METNHCATTDYAIERHFRPHQLALRMVRHGARTRTVCDWSGLTPNQLVTLRRRYGFDGDLRRRGPAPTAFHGFFKSKRHRREAAIFVCILHLFSGRLIQSRQKSSKWLPSLENGEVLCEALEASREWQPEGTPQFEHAILLAKGVAQGTVIGLEHCAYCRSMILVDRMHMHMQYCGVCKPAHHAAQGIRKEQPYGVPYSIKGTIA
jgi:Flagellar transcriptional activator (FlhC)